MSQFISRLFGKAPEPPEATTTDGRLVYAIGDVHGRLDVLEPLVAELIRDSARSALKERPLLILLGDYVDRGPSSAGVIEFLLNLADEGHFEVRALKGNHEEALLGFLDDPSFGQTWMTHGGGETLISYGVQLPTRNEVQAWSDARDALAQALPPRHAQFLQGLQLMTVVGDYAFVHAGVRPGAPLDRQTERDLLWIRYEFLDSDGPFEKVIVHGHTPNPLPQVTPWRLGIDTGAYATGVLTAVRLDDAGARMIQAKSRRAIAA